MTWQMACHALTGNCATESPSNSVAEFEYLKLSCRSEYQAGFDGEGVASAKREAQTEAGPMGPCFQHHSHHCRPLSPAVSPCRSKKNRPNLASHVAKLV